MRMAGVWDVGLDEAKPGDLGSGAQGPERVFTLCNGSFAAHQQMRDCAHAKGVQPCGLVGNDNLYAAITCLQSIVAGEALCEWPWEGATPPYGDCAVA